MLGATCASRGSRKGLPMNPAVSAALALSLVLGSTVVASADPIVFSNGPRNGNTERCDSQPHVCGGAGTWTIYDDFSLSSRTTVTGFSFSDHFADGSLNDYLDTEWSIWTSAEPASLLLLATGIAGLFGLRFRHGSCAA